jgi:TDG/mug DNA glycosylase family protein
VDRATVRIYERQAAAYAASRRAQSPERAERFAAHLPAGALRLDLGCGPGAYLPHLGRPVVAADAAAAMLAISRHGSPDALAVRCDLEALPFRRGAVGGVWASKAHQHVAPERLPMALAELHHALPVGGRLALTLFAGEGTWISDDDFPGRFFAWWEPDRLADLLEGAGFSVERLERAGDRDRRLGVDAVRRRTLADTVGPGMRMLVCGLNPSLYAADAGVGYARPGNRFWPAALAAGIATRDRDAGHLLRHHRVGLTDLVKRATAGAAELTDDEYRLGLARVERLCTWLRPAAVAFVGLTGWRRVLDRRATAGWQPRPVGGVPAYLLPSSSGLNAHTGVAELAGHLQAAASR